jgi:hypothetical protein
MPVHPLIPVRGIEVGTGFWNDRNLRASGLTVPCSSSETEDGITIAAAESHCAPCSIQSLMART